MSGVQPSRYQLGSPGNSSTIPIFHHLVDSMHLYMRRWLVLLIALSLPVIANAEPTWKINLKNADIREFITQVSAITGKSFIIDPRVKGNVTIISNAAMGKQAVYQLFLNVLRIYGYASVPASNGVERIVQEVLAKQSGNPLDFDKNAKGEQIITRVLPVRNASPAELVKTLRPLIPQYAQIAPLTHPNAIIVSDHADNIRRIAGIIHRIDIADTSTIQVVKLKNAWVDDMVAMLQKLAPDQIGKGANGPNHINIVASERTNSMVIKGDPESIRKINELIERLDVPANNEGAIQVIRLTHSDAKDMAELLKNIVSQKGTGTKTGGDNIQVGIQPDESQNALVIRADRTTMDELKEIVKKLDVPRFQVLIEAAIVEVTTNFTKELGSELAIGSVSGSTIPLGITAPAGTLASILESLALGTTPTNLSLGDAPLIAGGKVNRTGTSFAVILRALASNSNVNLLSTPSITTMDNQQAKIVVGQNVPFRTGSTVTTGSGTTNPFTTIQREDVGLTLQVTPHVHSGNSVRLEVHQEVSSVDQASLKTIGVDGSADIITNTRSIDTTVLAQNKQVIVLGGLMSDQTQVNKTKVPLLGDIPVLGHLFKSSTKTDAKLDLLVFLRPTVLSTEATVKAATERKFDDVWQVEIKGKGRTKQQALSDLFRGKH